MSSRTIRVRVLTTIALAALATTAASPAGAQAARRARPATRIPVTKEPSRPDTAAARPDTTPAPVSQAPPPPPPAAQPTPAPVTAVEAPPPQPQPEPQRMRRRHYGNGFYVGLAGGSGIPVGGIREAYNQSYTIDVPIGWDHQGSPLGVRLDLGYTRLDSRSSFRSTGTSAPPAPGASLALDDPQIWTAIANAKLRVPFFGSFFGPTSGVYVVGGGGVNHLRRYNTTFALTNPEFENGTVSTASSLTRFALDGGGGISWAFGPSEVFVESRYVTTFMPHDRASYVPIMLGFTVR